MFRPTVLSCWLLLGAAAFSQTPVPPQPALPSATMASDVMVNGLEFPNADVKDVLAYYERLTGKTLIYDVSVAGPVNIVVKSPLTKDEAVRIIEVSLLMNGYSLVPAGGGLIKVLGIGKNPRNYGIPIISDELNLPESEQVVTFVYKLRFADPQEVVQALSQYVPPSQSQYTQILPLPKSQTLLITENTNIIRGLLKVIREIDVPPAEVVSEFIVLERADAKTVVENLNKLFNPQEAGQGAPGGTRGARNVAGGVPRPGAPRLTPEGTPIPGEVVATQTASGSVEISSIGPTEESIIVGKAILTPDERTNRIHVVTRPVNLPFIRKLIKEFDQDVPFGIPATRHIRFRPAEEIFPVIVKAVTDPGAKAEETGAAGGTGTSGTRNTGSTSNRGGTSGDIFGNRDNNSSGLGGSSVASNVNDTLETQPRETKPIGVTIGSTRLIADNATNSIIVIGNQEVKAKVFQLIDKLDVRPPQVTLHTVVGELTLGENEQFGVDYIIRQGGRLGSAAAITGGTGTGNNNNGNGTGGLTSTGGVIGFNGSQPALNLTNLLNQRAITQIATAGSTGLSGFLTAGNSLHAIVTALEGTRRFRVTSRPSVTAQNNQVASIVSGQEIAIPGNIQSSLNSFNQSAGIVTNSTVQYKTVALKLEVLPLINSDREVSLDVVQRVDEVSGSTRIDQNDIPTVSTRAIKTHISVPNQGTLVLGGLIRQSETNSRSGIPYLSRIPVIGPLFRTTTKDKSRTELVVLIHPEVTMSPCEDVDMRERQMEYLNVDPDLETTLMPPNLRKRGTPDELLRRSQLMLRQDPECVEERTVEGFKK
ncbi:secretin N-terminal domain-containing protein [Verrucomicrobiota bacterium sgz303538]